MSRSLIMVPVLLAIGVLGLVGSGEAPKEPPPPNPPVKVRGMTVSCPTSGWEWGTDDMVETMRELRDLGVNWVSIHPYAHVSKDGSVKAYHHRGGSGVPRYVTRPIEEAHRLGMKILMKPHISYWGTFSWRGAIEFEDDEAWERFFTDYERWITELSAASAAADGFVVGTELEGTTHHEARWRKIIAEVRARYPGPITYASNWSDYQKVPFWDAVDVVGLQAYFPLISVNDPKVPPTEENIAAGWSRIMREVRLLSDRTGKNIVFTELGYNRSFHAAREPWRSSDTIGSSHPRHEEAEALQRRCLEVALRAIEAEPRVHGSFLWKWFPGRARPRDFDKSSPAMRRVLSELWGRNIKEF